MMKRFLALVIVCVASVVWAQTPSTPPVSAMPRRIPGRALRPLPAPPSVPSSETPPVATASASRGKATVVRPTEIDASVRDELRKRKGLFSFEFSKAEIIDVVKAMSDMTRQNFIIPEKIKGQRITILSPTKITAQEAYRVFYTALASNGITIVKSGKFYKLSESKESIHDTIPTCVGAAEDCSTVHEQMVTALLHLRYTDASQVLSVVKTLISKDGDVAVFQPTNALIMSEYAPNMARIRKILDALDVPGFDDELQMVQIEYATASEISEKLTQIFEVQGANGSKGARRPMDSSAPPDGNSMGGDQNDVLISKIVPDDRTNQIIIKAHRRSFEAIKNLISKLDVPISDVEQGNVHVHYLENAAAEELASTLSSLAQGQPTSSSKRAGGPGGSAGGSGGKESNSAVLFEGEVKITADKATNSLIIVATGRDYRSLRDIIERLDMPRRQVYVEAAILEVNVNDSDQAGLNWHAPVRFGKNDLGSLGGNGTFGFLQSAQISGGLSPTLSALSSPSALLGVAGGSMAGIIGKGVDVPVGSSTVSLPSFGVVLKWLQSSSNANILSTPHILTTDNEQASIEVGTKIPFQRGTALPSLGGLGSFGTGTGVNGNNAASALGGLGGGFGNLFSAVDRIDVSLKLSITPHINESNKIRMEIDQQIEDVSGQDERTQQPITANRSAKTVVVVDDQQTIVLGGLMRDKTTMSESKLPLLGDLPLLGWLFKQRTVNVEKVNLLLVLTPYIISEQDDFQRIFERKIAEHEEFAAEYYGDSSEYRAHIDYRKKSGPFARLASLVKKEKERYENGGAGDGSEVLVKPRTDASVAPVQPEAPAQLPAEPSAVESTEQTPDPVPQETQPHTDASVE